MWGLLILFATAAGIIVLAGTWVLIQGVRVPRRVTYATALGKGLPVDPAQLSRDFREQTITLSDGVKTNVWIIPGRRADGPAVVVTHSHSSSRYDSLTWAPLVYEQASQIVLYDMRAHGDSTAKCSAGGMREADDIIELLNQLGLAGDVVLYGLSMGAGVSIVAAAKDEAQRIVGVIADAPYRHRLGPLGPLLRSHSLPAQPFVALAQLYCMLRYNDGDGFDRAIYSARLKCPLLLFVGSEDHLSTPTQVREIGDAAPDATLVEIEGGGHLNLVQTDRDRYIAALEAFFAKLRGEPYDPDAPDSEAHQAEPEAEEEFDKLA